MSDPPSLPPGTLLADKFRIERLLGAGAMGAVYAIHHELTRHRRALKLLHPSARNVPDIVRRFLDEASAAGRAGNPHLVETFDAGTLPSGEPYVVMELLDGETLSALLEREGALEPARAAELVAQAAHGIEAAHGAGIIHRDLKPENLFVTERDGRPFVKILDFGVSKFATASGSMSRTRAGAMYGSPAYMSPEQIMGSADIDPRTDVFSLGVVLYQILTGQLPFDAPTMEALAVRVLSGTATPIETLQPNLPPPLIAIVRRALAPARDERFDTARALADALAPFRTDVGLSDQLGFADTVHGLPTIPTRSGSLPPAKGSARMLFGIVVLSLAALGATLIFRSRMKPASAPQAAADRVPLPANAVSAATPSLVIVTSAAADLVTNAVPVTHAPEAHTHSLHKSDARGVSSNPGAATSAAPPTPAASSSTPSSAAANLGLHQDNPFR